MPINYDRKFIFVHIPKTAGTSILCSLFDVDIDRHEFIDCRKFSKAHQRKHLLGDDGDFVRLHHYPLYRISAAQIRLDDFFVFSFVRNPFDRLVSEYHFLRLDRSMPFDEFVLNLVRMVFELGKLEEWFSFHFLPQTRFVTLDGKMRCNFLGKFETLEEDYRRVCEMLKFPWRPLPQYKRSERRHYRNYYNAESRALVTNYYKDDMEAFGYAF